RPASPNSPPASFLRRFAATSGETPPASTIASPTNGYKGFTSDDGVHQGKTIQSRLGAYEPRRWPAVTRVSRFRSRLGDEGRSEGQARRLGDPLRNSTRRGPRAMRDRAQRRRPGPAEPDSGRDRAQYRRSQDPPHAGHCAAWSAASPRREFEDRQRGGGTVEFPAMSSEWLRRSAGHGPSPDRQAEDRKDGDPRRLPDARGRRRRAGAARRLQGSLRTIALKPSPGEAPRSFQTRSSCSIVEVRR